MKYEITKEQRDGIVNTIANSDLPTKLGVQIICLLNGLPAVKEEVDDHEQK